MYLQSLDLALFINIFTGKAEYHRTFAVQDTLSHKYSMLSMTLIQAKTLEA